jgi:hypothetical protein
MESSKKEPLEKKKYDNGHVEKEHHEFNKVLHNCLQSSKLPFQRGTRFGEGRTARSAKTNGTTAKTSALLARRLL